MKKPTLCVIFGGKSSEYEVSLRSAYAVLSHLNKEKYDVVRLGITKGGEWYIFEGENEKILRDEWHKGRALPVAVDLTHGNLVVLGKDVYALEVDLFMPVLHGGYGEDGRIQGLFDVLGVPYVGCGAAASHVCMDKSLTKLMARELCVPVAKACKINAKCRMQNAIWERDCEIEKIGYPVFVKPTNGGSSIGASRVDSHEELCVAVSDALVYGDVLIEEYIEGYEVEVGALEIGSELVVSPVGMIRHKGKFYDYEAKYACQDNEYIIPAPIGEETAELIRDYTRRLFYGLGCRGFGRFDFFVGKNGRIIFNEVNTLPGFTDASMFPKLFMSMGYGFSEILDLIVASGRPICD